MQTYMYVYIHTYTHVYISGHLYKQKGSVKLKKNPFIMQVSLTFPK